MQSYFKLCLGVSWLLGPWGVIHNNEPDIDAVLLEDTLTDIGAGYKTSSTKMAHLAHVYSQAFELSLLITL